MSVIIAASFQTQSEVDMAIDALLNADFPSDQISSFFVTPAGQHAHYLWGGDHDTSAGAEDSARGTAVGIASGGLVGIAVGAVTSPFTGPLGVITGGLVGAHIGNLVGALSRMKEDEPTSNQASLRHTGMIVAVCTPDEERRQRAIAIFTQLGALELETSSGQIIASDWKDFDPTLPPQRIVMQDQGSAAS